MYATSSTDDNGSKRAETVRANQHQFTLHALLVQRDCFVVGGRAKCPDEDVPGSCPAGNVTSSIANE